MKVILIESSIYIIDEKDFKDLFNCKSDDRNEVLEFIERKYSKVINIDIAYNYS